MADTKKVWLVLMEGPNDERATYSHIESAVDKLFSSLKTQPKAIFYDITNQTDKGTFVNAQNIKSFINGKINDALKEYHIDKTDLEGVILIIDIDGVYIDDDAVVEDSSIDHIIYNETSVVCKNKEALLKRNERKRNNIEYLLTYVKYLMNVPFKIYFYSCNSEHVLFNEMNCSEARKVELSHIAMKYDDETFWSTVCDDKVVLSKYYDESWTELMSIEDKIPRASNLNVLYSEIKSIANDIEEKERRK